jgi:hypothetical protein
MIYLKQNRGITKEEIHVFAPLPTPLEFFTQIRNQTMVSEKVDIFEKESEFQNKAARFQCPCLVANSECCTWQGRGPKQLLL